MPTVKKSYLEFYRDPRWQKKRLEVMERDGFKCKKCGSDSDTLNVHHCYYEDGKKPWEYVLESLVTLCEDCHEEERDEVKKERALLLKALGLAGYTSSDINDLACEIYAASCVFSDKEKFLFAIHAATQSEIKKKNSETHKNG